MDKKDDLKESQNENKKIIITMLIITVLLAIITLILFVPGQLGYSSLSCSELDKESTLIIESNNFCKTDSDCILEKEVILHKCGCFEIVNKNTDLVNLKSKALEILQLEIKKSCPVPECPACVVPDANSIKCVDEKCQY